MNISLAIIEQRRLTCEGCDERVEFNADRTAVRCRKRGGGSSQCARCWAKLDTDRETLGCPVKGKWWYPDQPVQAAAPTAVAPAPASAAKSASPWPCDDPGLPPAPHGLAFLKWKQALSPCQWARHMTNLWRREGRLSETQHWWNNGISPGSAPGAIAAIRAANRPATPSLPSPPKPAGPAAIGYTNAVGETVHLRNHFKGRSVFLLCGGPSLAGFDLKQLDQPGIVTMAINNAAALHRPTMWIGSDEAHHFLMSIFTDPRIMKFFPWARRREQLYDSTRQAFVDTSVERCPNVWGMHLASRYDAARPAEWLSGSNICWGDHPTTMAAAMRVLFDLGFSRVFLAGCDWHMTAAKPYAFDQDKGEGPARQNNDKYAVWDRRFTELRPVLEEKSFHVYNCTSGSQMTAFASMEYRDAVKLAAAEISVDVASETTAGLYGAKKLQNPGLAQVRWATRAPALSRVVMTGGDMKQEWLLPLWYSAFRAHSDLPIIFADMGMSAASRSWCADRGQLISVIEPTLHPFNRKPLAMIQSPGALTLWLDLDAMVQGDVAQYFADLVEGKQIAISRDDPKRRDPMHVQAGVMSFVHGSPILLEVAQTCLDGLPHDMPFRQFGDQAVLNVIRQRDGEKDFAILAPQWNWVASRGIRGDVAVMHYAGSAKEKLRPVAAITAPPV